MRIELIEGFELIELIELIEGAFSAAAVTR